MLKFTSIFALIAITATASARPIPRPLSSLPQQSLSTENGGEAATPYRIPNLSLMLHATTRADEISDDKFTALFNSALAEATKHSGPVGASWTHFAPSPSEVDQSSELKARNEDENEGQVQFHVESTAPRFLWRDVKNILKGVEGWEKEVVRAGGIKNAREVRFEVRDSEGSEEGRDDRVLAKGWVGKGI